MELQFEKMEVPCLRQLSSQILNQEQTLEVRLDDSKPEIGTVLAAWGQPVLRGKEWNRNGVQVSGGVMAWVLYIPQNGGPCCSAEAWLPFQWRIDVPYQEGSVIAACVLKSIDARSLSEKKLMVRANASLQMQAFAPDRATFWEPADLPEDLQLKKECCKVTVPVELGEKPFVIDELLQPPPDFQKLLRCSLQPELSERKVMADKVVFRGVGLLHILYLGTDGMVHTWDPELPFAQYGQLEGQFGEKADTQICLAVTSLDLTPAEGSGLHLNAGLTGQYLVFEEQDLQLVTDAYSTTRTAKSQCEEPELPVVLDLQSQSLPCRMTVEGNAKRIVDGFLLPESPKGTEDSLELAAGCQVLYYNENDELAVATGSWEEGVTIPVEEHCHVQGTLVPNGLAQVNREGGGLVLQAEMQLDTLCVAPRTLRTIKALELSDLESEKEERPSLILRRAGQESLWDMAKATGSTVNAIMEANGLEGEPLPEQFLLIPVS